MGFVSQPGFDMRVLFIIGKELELVLHSLQGHSIHRPIIPIRFHNHAALIHTQLLPIITIQTNIMIVIRLFLQVWIGLSHHIRLRC